MKTKVDLTIGNIRSKLIKLALPIMMISFMQMAYNMIDMMWLGRVGYKAVAASGTAGFYMWLSFSLVLISKIGAEINVSKYTGAKDELKAREYARSAVQLGLFLGVLYALVMYVFRDPLIHFVNIKDEATNLDGMRYLSIIAIGFPLSFYNQIMSGIYYGVGSSKIPLKFSSVGLGMNIVLDYFLIFGAFGFSGLGVVGAAYATVISQFTITFLFSYHIKSESSPFSEFHIFRKPVYSDMFEIARLGYPAGLMSGMYTFFALVIARMLSDYGDIPIAVQRVGAQIESISWMTAGGFQSAIRSFTGQNLGAKKTDRIREGFFVSIKIMTVFGLIVTFFMFFYAGEIFALFLPDPKCLPYGMDYLKILSLSQLLMMYEMLASGAFNGLGMTKYPALIGIVFTGLRIPFASVFAREDWLGLNGFWWTITMSSNLKGVILLLSFIIVLKYSQRFKTGELRV